MRGYLSAVSPPTSPRDRAPRRWFDVFAVAVVLAILGTYALILFQGRALLRGVRESTVVVAELRPTADDAAVARERAWLSEQPFVKEASLAHIDPAAGEERLRAAFGEAFLGAELDNPLYHVLTFNVAEAESSPERLARAVAAVSARDDVLYVEAQDNLLSAFADELDTVAYAGLAVGLLLLAGAALLIVNGTRLQLLARATTIRSMELVGASWGYIARPFLRGAAGRGLIAGLLATALTAALSLGVRAALPAVWSHPGAARLGALALALCGLGIILNFVATYFVVRSTLRLRADDLARLR